jgi:hypothetical protein
VTGELAIRFLLGGTVVSLFAVLGSVFKPPSFAGLFGSAPSLAIATLALAFFKEGGAYAVIESRSMVVGASGLIAYSTFCLWTVQRCDLPVWVGAAICWVTWFAVTFGVWSVIGA